MANYVAWVRWRKEVAAPITETDGRKQRPQKKERTVESGDEIYPISANTDEEAIAEAKNSIAPSQARGEGSIQRRIVKLWKVKGIEIPK